MLSNCPENGGNDSRHREVNELLPEELRQRRKFHVHLATIPEPQQLLFRLLCRSRAALRLIQRWVFQFPARLLAVRTVWVVLQQLQIMRLGMGIIAQVVFRLG